MKKVLSILKKFCVVLCLPISLLSVSCGTMQKEIHGTELLKLTDDQLYEKVYLQMIDLVESYPEDRQDSLVWSYIQFGRFAQARCGEVCIC